MGWWNIIGLAAKVAKQWIISVISQEEPKSAGPVMVTAEEPLPLPPTDPPHLCAYEAQQVELLGAQLEAILAQYQAAVEAFTACMESTIPASMRSDFDTKRGYIETAIAYMKQNIAAIIAIVRKMRSR